MWHANLRSCSNGAQGSADSYVSQSQVRAHKHSPRSYFTVVGDTSELVCVANFPPKPQDNNNITIVDWSSNTHNVILFHQPLENTERAPLYCQLKINLL